MLFSPGSLIKVLGVNLNSASKQTVWALKLPNSAKKCFTVQPPLRKLVCKSIKNKFGPGYYLQMSGENCA